MTNVAIKINDPLNKNLNSKRAMSQYWQKNKQTAQQ